MKHNIRLVDMPSLFLCHSSIDKAFVRKLAKDLTAHGVKCWIDEIEMRVGDSLLHRISEGISDCRFFAVVLSRSSTKSVWVRKELEIALSSEIMEDDVKVLPVLLENCRIPPFLKGKVYADFRSTYANGLSALAGAISPKSKYEISAIPKNQKGSPEALVSFRDEMDEPVLRQLVPLTTTVGQIRKANPSKSEGLWTELKFKGVKHLNRIELFNFKNTRKLRLSFDFDLNQLVPKLDDEQIWRWAADIIQQKIWTNGQEILAALDSTELAVNWGGPDAKQVSAETEVMFYIDSSFGYVIITREFPKKSALDQHTLQEIRARSLRLSDAVVAIEGATSRELPRNAKKKR